MNHHVGEAGHVSGTRRDLDLHVVASRETSRDVAAIMGADRGDVAQSGTRKEQE